jgi:hypothetical protein
MKSRKTRTLTKAELRALAVTPGLMAHRVGPDGRARLEQLTADGSGRSSFFTARTKQLFAPGGEGTGSGPCSRRTTS